MKQSCFPIQQGVEVTVFLRYSSPQPFTKDILNQRDGSRDCSQIGTMTFLQKEENITLEDSKPSSYVRTTYIDHAVSIS
jgi:hypothetical protein